MTLGRKLIMINKQLQVGCRQDQNCEEHDGPCLSATLLK